MKPSKRELPYGKIYLKKTISATYIPREFRSLKAGSYCRVKYDDEILKSILLRRAEELRRVPKMKEVPFGPLINKQLGGGRWNYTLELVDIKPVNKQGSK